jgi:hypothetical protein
VPKSLIRIFGPPPLVGDESPIAYRELFSLLAADFEPQRPRDWLFLKDLVDLHWERLRERRIKAVVIKIYQEQPLDESWQQPVFIMRPEDANL